MAIVYPVDMPLEPAPQEASIYILKKQSARIAKSGRKSVQKDPGDKWIGSIDFPMIDADGASEWLGFFDCLDGMIGTFLMPHPDYTEMRGSASGATGRVDGTGQKGNELVCDGWPPNSTFKRGDLVQVGEGAKTRLKRVVKNAEVNSSGRVTLDIQPGFHSAPGDNERIFTTDCKGLFTLAEPMVAPTSDANRIHKFSVAIEEKLV